MVIDYGYALTMWLAVFVLSVIAYWGLCRFANKRKNESLGFVFVIAGMILGMIFGSGSAFFYLDITNKNHPLGLWFMLLVGACFMVVGGLCSVIVYGRLVRKQPG
jgi:hypothetical protein